MCSTLTKWKWNNLRFTYLFAAAWCLLLTTGVQAQIQQPLRFEVPLSGFDKPFEVTSAQTHGLYLHRTFQVNNQQHMQVVRVDTTFQELWGGFISIPNNLVPVDERSTDVYIHFLFRESNSNNFHLYRMAHEQGTYSHHVIKSFIPFAPTAFQATANALLIGGYFNKIPLVLYYDLATGQSKVLPGLFNDEGELTQIKTYPNNSFDVLISAKNFQKQQTLWIKNYRPDGSLISNLSLQPDDRKALLFGRSLKTLHDQQIVAGVYGRHNNEFARGIFIATIAENGYQQIKYYNFGDLENFFSYMKANRELRVRNRIERRKIKGKKIKFNYRILVHEVIEYKDQYILLGEAFYPRYKSISSSGYGGGFFQGGAPGGSLLQGNQIFDGYQYTHAAIMGFDKNGQLLWDNSFEINGVKTFTLKQYVRFEVVDDKIVLLYLYDNQLRTKIIQDNRVLEGESIDPIRERFEDDVALENGPTVSQLHYWYDHYFYAFGVQDIVNLSHEEVPPRRHVFFLNKISSR